MPLLAATWCNSSGVSCWNAHMVPHISTLQPQTHAEDCHPSSFCNGKCSFVAPSEAKHLERADKYLA